MQEGYLFKFYFWLDLVSLFTMSFDLVWVVQLMNVGQVSNAANVVQIARAGRASRLGARTARFIRIIRLVRMLKLYKDASTTMTVEQERRTSKVGNPTPAQVLADRSQQDNSPKVLMLTDSIKEDRALDPDTKEKVEDSEHHSGTVDKWELEKTEVKRNKFKLPPLVMPKKPGKLPEGEVEKLPPTKASDKKLPGVEGSVSQHDHSSVKKVSTE